MLFALANFTCRSFTHDNYDPYDLEPFGYAYLTEIGLTQYMRINQLEILDRLAGQKLPLEINENIFMMNIQLTNLIVTQVVIGNLEIQLFDDQTGAIKLSDLIMELSLQFQIQQKSYPFLEDSGTGLLTLDRLSIFARMGIVRSEKCIGKINLVKISGNLEVKALKIVFTGNLAYIYNSIMGLMTDLITNAINGQLGPVFIDGIVGLVGGLCDDWQMNSTMNDTLVNTDNRWTNSPQFIDRGCYIPRSYQRCVFDETSNNFRCKGNYSQNISTRPVFLTNAHSQNFLSTGAFNAGFALFKEVVQNLSVGADELQITSFFAPKFENTGMRIDIGLKKGQEECEVHFFVPVVVKFVSVSNIAITVGFDNIVGVSGNLAINQTELMGVLNKKFDPYQLTIVNSQNVDQESYQVIYIDDYWILQTGNYKAPPKN